MSLKPPKKSDMKKGWMKSRRDKTIKIQPEYHLIVTEGTNTEPAYFGAIRDIINAQYRGKVQLDVYGEGDNTLNLLDRAKKRVLHSSNVYKHVWVVYDTDDFSEANIDLTEDLCNQYSNSETEYHSIWSNQCIELWYLLHFSFLQTNIHRNEYWPKLTAALTTLNKGTYTKNRQDMFAVLRPKLDTAIANAKRLDSINIGKPPSKSAPGTKVFELLEKLKTYISVQ